jgi:hypothetical protein
VQLAYGEVIETPGMEAETLGDEIGTLGTTGCDPEPDGRARQDDSVQLYSGTLITNELPGA